MLNQAGQPEKIQGINEGPLDIKAFPTDALVGYFKDALLRLPAGAQSALGALIDGVSGPALRYWNAFANGKAGPKAAAALAAISGKQFVRVPVVGNRGAFVQAMMRQIYMLDPQLKTRPNDLGKAVAAQTCLLQVEGLDIQKTDKRAWYVLLDQEAIAAAKAKNLSGDALARELAKAITKPDDLRKLDINRWKGAIESPKTGLAAGMLGGLLQLYNFQKVAADYSNAMSHEAVDAQRRFFTAIGAMAGTLSEALGNGINAFSRFALNNAVGLGKWTAPKLLSLGGRLLGLGAGIAMAVWDGIKGYEEYKKGDIGLAAGYFVLAGLGAWISFAFFFSSLLGPIGWVCVGIALLALFIITAVMEKSKDNKIQEWLSRCYFSSGPEKYADSDTEQAQLKLAFA